MTEEIIQKRLHISGLTPAITPESLSQRLGSFGIVKTLDGFGKVDALGQPRKFAYVTIETTKSKLARCMNLLSGVTWKGANLRLGEAKPDFRERISAENAKYQDGEPPRKKRRLPRGVQGVHAEDMSLVTPENVKSHGGWKVTPSGRMVRPVRMRPLHPLPDPLEDVSSSRVKGSAAKEKKRKPKEPPIRARRRTIDPTKWNSKHLKGAFLNAVVAYPEPVSRQVKSPQRSAHSPSGSESSSDDESEDGEPPQPRSPPSIAAEIPKPSTSSKPVELPTKPVVIPSPFDNELLQEKNASLGLLQSLFGNNDDDWGGKETLSDVEMDEPRAIPQGMEGDDDFEVVPRSVLSHPPMGEEMDSPSISPSPSPTAAEPNRNETRPEATKPKLKDLFAHREEAGFSLLGHLDIDDELDEHAPDFTLPQAPITRVVEEPTAAHVLVRPTNRAGFLTLDTKEPLFFPISEEERDHIKGKVRDIFDVARENGVDWRNFRRTQTEEEIKSRWEQNKKNLTQEWKRRHREAIKSRRRRGGYDGGAE